MRIDNYNEIKRFFDENLVGREVSMMFSSYIKPATEYKGKLEEVSYYGYLGEEVKDTNEKLKGSVRFKIGNSRVNLDAGFRRESDKLDLISFEHDKQIIYYLASEDDRENGTGIFFKKIE